MAGKPISVQLVTAPGCSKCVQAKQTNTDALGRLQHTYRIDVQEVDLTEQPEIATEHGIWATPALVIDGELAFVGSINDQELSQKLAAAAERTG